MKELLITIAQGLVEDPSAVSVDVEQGRIAKAIRTVMKSVATRANEKIRVDID